MSTFGATTTNQIHHKIEKGSRPILRRINICTITEI